MRVWKSKASDQQADLDLDQVKDEIIAHLSTVSDSLVFALVSELVKELEACPSIMSVEDFLNRLKCLNSDAAAIIPINNLLLKLKLCLDSWSYTYSSAQIEASQAFAHFADPPIGDSTPITVGSQGSYLMYPSTLEIQAALDSYNRDNRLSLKLYDETGSKPNLVLERNSEETQTPSRAEFKAAILRFCEDNVIMANFIAANSGPSSLGFIVCEHVNTLCVEEPYITLFALDEPTQSWHKLRDEEGHTYYRHRLYAACYHLKTNTAEIHALTNCSLGGTLEKVEAGDYGRLRTAGKLAPLVSTLVVTEIKFHENRLQQPRVVEYTTCIASSKINYRAEISRMSDELSVEALLPNPSSGP